MKPKIHPDFHKINVTCACGNSFETCSTSKELKVEVCSNCHPFFTGTQRFVDTTGRVERFQAKIDKTKQLAEENAAKKSKTAAKTTKSAVVKTPVEVPSTTPTN
ncbi:MAG: 50S ribosomal protein L31 [Candidatus Riflebacteria bacterium]|nr:50S ribosomal protein L31 [Candidatus Riflebacteria bacterium]